MDFQTFARQRRLLAGRSVPELHEYIVSAMRQRLACIAGGIRGHKGESLKYRLPKN